MTGYFTPKDEVLTYTIGGGETIDIIDDLDTILSIYKNFPNGTGYTYYIGIVRILSGNAFYTTSSGYSASSVGYRTDWNGGLFNINEHSAGSGTYNGFAFKKDAETEVLSDFIFTTNPPTTFKIINHSSETVKFAMCSLSHIVQFQRLKGQGIKLAGTNVVRVTGVDYKGLGGNFYAPESPITAESYATLISNASQVTDKAITISTESAKLIAEYGHDIAKDTPTNIWETSMRWDLSSYTDGLLRIKRNSNVSGFKYSIVDKNNTTSTWTTTTSEEVIIPFSKGSGENYIFVAGYNWEKDATSPSDYGIECIELLSDSTNLITLANSKGFAVKTMCRKYNTFEQGSIHSTQGTLVVSTTRIRQKEYISDKSFTILGGSGAIAYTLMLYNSTGTFGREWSKGWVNCETNTTITPDLENYSYYKIILKYQNESDILPTSFDIQQTYTLLPSLSFDGSHYVNSGLSAKSDSNAIIDYYTTGVGIQILFGIAEDTSKYFDYVCAYNGSARIDYNSTTTRALIDTCSGRHIIDYGNENVDIDGTTIVQTGDISATGIIPIGACLGANDAFTFPLKGSIYSATINGQLFIPSNNGTTDGLLNLSTLEFKPLTAV